MAHDSYGVSMVPQHNLKSKNIKEKSGSQSGHPVETPDKDLRRARKALPGGPGGDEKMGFLERRPPGSPEKEHEKRDLPGAKGSTGRPNM